MAITQTNRRQFLAAGSAVAVAAPAGQLFAQNAAPAAAAAPDDLPTVVRADYAAPSKVTKIYVRNLRVLEDQAREVIPKGGFGYISSAAGDEWTYHENIAAFKRKQILPRYLSGNEAPDASITLLGTKLPIPIITTVFGGHAIAHVTAEAGTAKGTWEGGHTIFTCGSQANLPMEQVMAASPGPKWMQLYFQTDRGRMREFLQRARASGYKAIVITTDAFFPSNRETDIDNHYSSPFQAANFPPQTVTGYAGGTSTMKHDLNWDDIAFVQKESGLPVLVKGVLTPEMALLAVKNGCAGIQVSNHGGRQLDDTPATFTMLPRIADAVGGRIPIVFDSGVRRGQDVFKALAEGATAVALGRPILYGLALGGWMGVASVYEKIRAEFLMTMMAAGTGKISDIKRSLLTT